jgi:macrodomain Ter protein organizer (MatP/YcbG family)
MATPIRSIRIACNVWTKASRKAKEQGTTVSAVINAALLEYIKD